MRTHFTNVLEGIKIPTSSFPQTSHRKQINLTTLQLAWFLEKLIKYWRLL